MSPLCYCNGPLPFHHCDSVTLSMGLELWDTVVPTVQFAQVGSKRIRIIISQLFSSPDRQTESDAYEPIVQVAHVGSKSCFLSNEIQANIYQSCFPPNEIMGKYSPRLNLQKRGWEGLLYCKTALQTHKEFCRDAPFF